MTPKIEIDGLPYKFGKMIAHPSFCVHVDEVDASSTGQGAVLLSRTHRHSVLTFCSNHGSEMYKMGSSLNSAWHTVSSQSRLAVII